MRGRKFFFRFVARLGDCESIDRSKVAPSRDRAFHLRTFMSLSRGGKAGIFHLQPPRYRAKRGTLMHIANVSRRHYPFDFPEALVETYET